MRSKRDRVIGNGPDRKTLPTFRHLGSVDDAVMALAIAEARQAECDCGKDHYPLSIEHPLKYHFGEDYIQHLLQHPVTNGLDPKDYIVNASPIVDVLRKTLNGMAFYRARMSCLKPGHVAPWHIDTNTSVACRLQFMIEGEAKWSVKRGGEIETQIIRPGEIWFCNSGFPHMVENCGVGNRWVMILDCDYMELEKTFGSIKLEVQYR